jgi:DNA protecting protein DprA
VAEQRSSRATADPERTAREIDQLSPTAARDVGIGIDDLSSLVLLETIRAFGPQKFKELHEAGLRPVDVLLEPDRLPIRGKRGDAFREAIAALDVHDRQVAQARAVRQIARAHTYDARIVTYADADYPPQVYASNNPIPVLYARGDTRLLGARDGVACVGSRAIDSPYRERHFEFASRAAQVGHPVVSGFALGADTLGHEAAYQAGGPTILVMPCGLDRPFPPENRELWETLLGYDRALVVSEFPFGTAASALTLRKRNKLIVAFAAGVLLSQSSAKGGAMNAYRFALEQRKPVATFAPNGAEPTSGNRLIAESEGQGRLEGDAAGVAVFPAERADPDRWSAWLRGLSSST